ncbi:MAG: hypothetical protein ACRDWI_10035 [Jiangellaceae bacterium]
MLPRRFALIRHIDYTGVSGLGVVAYGVAFSDGHVVLRWCSSFPATSVWNSLDDLLAIHGHGEGTSIQWIDTPLRDLEDLPETSRVGRRARRRAAARASSSAVGTPAPSGPPAGPATTPDAEPPDPPDPLDPPEPAGSPAPPEEKRVSTAAAVDDTEVRASRNGFTRPSDAALEAPVPRPRAPGRHRRTSRVEPSR